MATEGSAIRLPKKRGTVMEPKSASFVSVSAFIVGGCCGVFGVALLFNAVLGVASKPSSHLLALFGFLCLVICLALYAVGIFARRASNSVQRF